MSDLTFALRLLRRSPGFALVAVITLALGIGANSAIFALVDAVLLPPLPFPDPDRLVMLWERTDRSPRAAVSPLNMADWNERNTKFRTIAGYVPNVGGMVMNGRDGIAETIASGSPRGSSTSSASAQSPAGRSFHRTRRRERTSWSSTSRSGAHGSTPICR